jgi:hypothetical protein
MPPRLTRPINPNNYGRALLSAPSQAIAPHPHTNLLNVIYRLQIKWGFKNKILRRLITMSHCRIFLYFVLRLHFSLLQVQASLHRPLNTYFRSNPFPSCPLCPPCTGPRKTAASWMYGQYIYCFVGYALFVLLNSDAQMEI